VQVVLLFATEVDVFLCQGDEFMLFLQVDYLPTLNMSPSAIQVFAMLRVSSYRQLIVSCNVQ